MKLNKLLIAVSIATFALASCESEFTKDAELNVNVATGDGVSFDGQTITVASGTPGRVPITTAIRTSSHFTAVRPEKNINIENVPQWTKEKVQTSTLKFKLTPQYGKPENILTMYVSADFPGLEKGNFEVDSVLVEQHAWETLIPAADFPATPKAQDFEVDMKPYLGKRIAVAICYRGQDKSATQSRFTFGDIQEL